MSFMALLIITIKMQCNGGRKWVKKVQQEWSILEKNLPGKQIWLNKQYSHADMMNT